MHTRSCGGEGRGLILLCTCVKHECAKSRIFPVIHSPFYLGPGIKSDHYQVKAIMRSKHLFPTAVGKLGPGAPGLPGPLEVTAMRQSKSRAKNVITTETGLIRIAQLSLVPVLKVQEQKGFSHTCTHAHYKSVAWAHHVHLKITLCFWSCVQSFLLTHGFLTSHRGTWLSQNINKHLSAYCIHRVVC